jgi:hypothetical protein
LRLVSHRKLRILRGFSWENRPIVAARNLQRCRPTQKMSPLGTLLLVAAAGSVKLVVQAEDDREDAAAHAEEEDVPTLRDHPIESGHPALYLDGSGWTATHSDARAHSPLESAGAVPPPLPGAWAKPVPATVPGDILTDLQRAGGPDPYFNSTWRDPEFIRTWNEGVWTYSTSFVAPATGKDFVLAFDGIRMGAMIHLNGHFLGNATDQFLRYTFSVDCSVLVCGSASLRQQDCMRSESAHGGAVVRTHWAN